MMLLTSLLVLPMGGHEVLAAVKVGKGFHAPVQITADGQPHEGILYPSPTVFDLDGDGTEELLIGEIFGSITVSDRAKGEDGLAWAKGQKMKSGGEPIKLNNW